MLINTHTHTHITHHPMLSGYLAHNGLILILVNWQRGAMHPRICTEMTKSDKWWPAICLCKSMTQWQHTSSKLHTFKYLY